MNPVAQRLGDVHAADPGRIGALRSHQDPVQRQQPANLIWRPSSPSQAAEARQTELSVRNFTAAGVANPPAPINQKSLNSEIWRLL